MMMTAETRAQIRHWFYAEHWKIGTIAQQLALHPSTVRHALESAGTQRAPVLRRCLTDPYLPFIRQTLDQYPRLRATRIYQMLRERGYSGSVVQFGGWWPHYVRFGRSRSCACRPSPPNKRKSIGLTSAKWLWVAPAAASPAS